MKNLTFFEGGGEGDPREAEPMEGDLRGRRALIHNFSSQLLLVNIWKCCVSNCIKIAQ